MAVPADFRVLDVGDTYLKIAWTDTAGQNPIILIEGRLETEQDFCLKATLEEGIQEWETAVQPDSTYVYRIAAANSDSISQWTPPLSITALRSEYWDVSGGISNESCVGLSLFFRFGRAIRFYPRGTPTITGPDDWNDGIPFQRDWSTFYIGLNSNYGVCSGDFRLFFGKDDRRFSATVTIDDSLVLPLPTVDIELLPERSIHATWSCDDADRFAICWGPM